MAIKANRAFPDLAAEHRLSVTRTPYPFQEVDRALAADRVEGTAFVPFDAHEDYLRHVDGRPRTEGARTFLSARGICLPEQGPPGDCDTATVAGLVRSKDRHFLDRVDRDGARAFPGTVDLVRALRSAGLPVAAASASRYRARVLRAAGAEDLAELLPAGPA